MRKLSILALVVLASTLAACGGSDGVSEAELERQKEAAAKQAKQEEQIRQLRIESRERKAEDRRSSKDDGGKQGTTTVAPPRSGPAPSGGGSKACGGGLSVNSVTTCGFASNVREAYNSNGPGSVPVFSPATGEEILMSCSGSGPTVCTGGRGAAVYFP